MRHRYGVRRLAGTAWFAAIALLLALPAVAQTEGHEAMAKGQEAKAKAEAMMAQGEEMKAKAGEMKAQGEEMKAKAGEMKAQGEEMKAQGEQPMSPEEAAMMKAWQEAMTPGEPQAHLAKAAGDFDFTVKWWMDPTADPQVSTGTAHREMIMGGRYLVEKVKGVMMGQDFHGMGTTGYDNTKGTYWNTWFDNMSTGVMVSEGKADDSGKMVMMGDYVDPMTRQTKTSKTVLWWDGADKETMEMYDQRGEDWVKTMEIVYTRTK